MAARKLKDFYKNYTPIQAKVREITSNDPLKPIKVKHVMYIEKVSNDEQECFNIISVLDQRLKDTGKNWRHVSKALQLLFELILHGSPRIHRHYSTNIHKIKCLEDFNHIDNYKDVGAEVRRWSKKVLTLLTDERLLEVERSNAKAARAKFLTDNIGISCSAVPRSTNYDHQTYASSSHAHPRQSRHLEMTVTENEYENDIKRAIELSIMDEEKRRKDEENFRIKMQMALNESKTVSDTSLQDTKCHREPDIEEDEYLFGEAPKMPEPQPQEMSLLEMFDEYSSKPKETTIVPSKSKSKAPKNETANELFDDLFGGSYQQPRKILPPKSHNRLPSYTLNDNNINLAQKDNLFDQLNVPPNETVNPYMKINKPTPKNDIDDFFN